MMTYLKKKCVDMLEIVYGLTTFYQYCMYLLFFNRDHYQYWQLTY